MFWTPSLTFNTTSIKNYCTTDISRWTDHNGDLEHQNKWHHILEACLLWQIFCHNEGGCDREDQLAGWFYLKETDKEKICFTSVTQDHNNYNSTQHHNTQHVRSYLPMSPLQCIISFSLNHWLWPNQCRGHLVEVCKEETVSLGWALLQLHLLEQALHEKPDAVEDHCGAERVEHLVGQLTLIVLNYHDDEAPNVCTENKQLLKDTELLKILKPC